MVWGSAGAGRDLQGIRGSEGNAASISHACSGSGKPAEIPGLNLCYPGPLLASNVLTQITPQGLF